MAVSEAMPKADRLIKMLPFGSQALGNTDAGSDIDIAVHALHNEISTVA